MKVRWFVQVSCLLALILWEGQAGLAAKPGGTLRLAYSADLTFFNANQGPAPGYPTFWVWNNIFQSLLTLTRLPS
jgi:hypothetical protein